MIVKKKENETEYEFHKRLVYGKLVDKTINADYDKLAFFVYGKKYSPDVARRMMYGSRYTMELKDRCVVDSVDNDEKYLLEELTRKKYELELERKKLQAEKTEYNRWIREDAREDLFIEKFIDSIHKAVVPKKKHDIKIKNRDSEKEGVLCFADCHFGKEYKIYGLDEEIISEYSPDIFYERMEELLSETIRIGKENNLKKIKVLFLGDALDGFLRNSQLSSLKYGVVDSAILYGNFLSDWLYRLSKIFYVEYYQVSGNHGELRLLDGKKGEHVNDNIEKVTLELMKAGNKNNENLKIVDNKSGFIYVNSCGYDILGTHGDSKSSKDAISDFSTTYKKNIDYLICGHKHHSYLVNSGYKKYMIGIGSIVGVDDYSAKILKTAEASADFLIFEKNKGRSVDYSIKLN